MASMKQSGMSSFAQEQLEKHGWREGIGLGRHENGITNAIKVKIKNDSHGVGHDPGKEFTYHWWDHAFNKAANSITVENSKDGVKVEKCDDLGKQGGAALTYASKAMLYGRFVKAATLNDGIEIKEEKVEESSDSEDEDSSAKKTRCTDEAMLKICGGRTAHKAARHGLGLSGKLLRIAQQEEKLMQSLSAGKESSGTPVTTCKDSSTTDTSSVGKYEDINAPEKKKEKKRKKDKKEKRLLKRIRETESSELSEKELEIKKQRTTKIFQSEGSKGPSNICPNGVSEKSSNTEKQIKKSSKKVKNKRKERGAANEHCTAVSENGLSVSPDGDDTIVHKKKKKKSKKNKEK